jgi:hypothetical protein
LARRAGADFFAGFDRALLDAALAAGRAAGLEGAAT